MPMRILTIDDDPATTELLTLILKAQGMEVYSANSGMEGIKIIREVEPDVVIVDLIMPGYNGWQVFTDIRKFNNVPIVVLSSLDDPVTVARALDAGADDYIIKPVVSGVLIARLNKLVRRSTKKAGVGVPVRATATAN